MSEPTKPLQSDSQNPSDPSLDMTSEKFDPLKALYSNAVIIPKPDAPMLDNIAAFEGKQKRELLKNSQEAIKRRENKALASKSKTDMPVRRFLPHQEMIQSTSKFVEKNIFTRMEDIQEGPIAALRRALEPGAIITVKTRYANKVRGTLHGQLVAFDKNWNLAMTNITEEWVRRSFKKATTKDEDALSSAIRAIIPAITVRRLNSKYETCTRFVKQMMVRGEHVVLIEIN